MGMSVNDTIKNVQITTLKIKNDQDTVDLKQTFLTFNIYEDLFSPFLFGKIVISDTYDMINLFPFLGGEDITVGFKTINDKEPAKWKTKTYKVYKIKEHEQEKRNSNKNQLLTLYFCSPELFKDGIININKKYKMTGSAVVNEMLTTMMETQKDKFIESSSNTLEFVANFWTPLRVIEYCEKLSEGAYDDFIFFESSKGFHYEPFSTIAGRGPKHTFYRDEDFKNSFKIDRPKIMSFKNYFDVYNSLETRSYGNTFYQLFPHNYGFKKYQNNYDLNTAFNTTLGKFQLHNKELKNFNDIHTSYEFREHLSKRMITIKLANERQLILKMNGDTTRHVSDIVKFNMDYFLREKSKVDEINSGMWLISGINHEVSQAGDFEQNVKLIRNGQFNYSKRDAAKGNTNA